MRAVVAPALACGALGAAGCAAEDESPSAALPPSGTAYQALSDDERLIPLRLSTMDSVLTATAEIMPECLGPTGCPPISG